MTEKTPHAELAELFTSGLAPERAAQLGEVDDLERHLEGLVEAGRAAWPGIALSPERFMAFVAGRFPPSGEAARALEQLPAADLYLACACAAGDVAAVALFEEHTFEIIDRALPPIGCDPSLIDEVKQNLRARLFVPQGGKPAKINQYAGQGSLKGWIKIAAVREARGIQRKGKREVPASDEELIKRMPPPAEDLELAHLKRLYRKEFKQAFSLALAGLAPRDRNILRYHYLERLNIDGIGVIFSVHRATVARWLTRIRQELLQSTRQAMTDQLRISDSEFQSIMHLIESRLEVSIQQYLTPEDEKA